MEERKGYREEARCLFGGVREGWRIVAPASRDQKQESHERHHQ